MLTTPHGLLAETISGAVYCNARTPPRRARLAGRKQGREPPHAGEDYWLCGAAWRRRYARVFVRLPQSCIEHQLAERFFE